MARVSFQPLQEAADPFEESEADEEKAMEDDLQFPDVILALHSVKKSTGAACYCAADNSIQLFEDTQDAPGDLAALIAEQTEANTVLLSSKADEAFRDTIMTSDAMTRSQPKVETRPGKEFASHLGHAYLLDIGVLDGLFQPQESTVIKDEDGNVVPMPDQLDWARESNYTKLGAYVNVQAPVMLAAVAALVPQVSRLMAVHYRNRDALQMVSSIRLIKINEVMFINRESLAALQVLPPDLHSSSSSTVKDSLSLYALLNNTKTPSGKELLKQWLLRPSASLPVIVHRHNAVECFSNSSHQHLADSLHAAMRPIKNLSTVLRKHKQAKARLADWSAIKLFLLAALDLVEHVTSLHGWQAVDVCARFAAAAPWDKLKQMLDALESVLDWKESKLHHRVCVRPGVNAELDRMRDDYSELPSKLDHIARAVSDDMPTTYMGTLNIAYYPQLGYLICLPLEEETLERPDDWVFQFQTEVVRYFKSEKMRDLDRYLGDIASHIIDTELEITAELQHDLLQDESFLLQVHDLVAELDCLLSFASVSRDLNWHRPTMTNDTTLHIANGRHPLVELTVDAYVPNTLCLSGGFEPDPAAFDTPQEGSNFDPRKSVLVISGPNSSGKSCFGKANALIVLLAHVGCFGPFQDATIGVTDSILTRVSTRESASRTASAFLLDLHQVSFSLRNCTERSLLVIDEFGKGTESQDGAGLFAGLCHALIRRGRSCPKAILATHYQHIFFMKDLVESRPLALAHMALVKTGSALHQNDYDFAFTFKLREGLLKDSLACECASKQGISHRVTARAAAITSAFWSGKKVADEADSTSKDAEAVSRMFLQADFSTAVNIRGLLEGMISCRTKTNASSSRQN